MEIIGDNLSRAGWSWGCVSTVDSNGRTIFVADSHRDDGKRFVVHADEESGKRTRAVSTEYFGAMKMFFSIILALALSLSTALATHGGDGEHRGHGGYHGKHAKHGKYFVPRSARSGHKFSRSESKFSRGKSGKYRKWSGRNWSRDNWNGDWRNNRFSVDQFIAIGGFGPPYSFWDWYPEWGWSAF
jgi:hypothetical protein